MDINVNSNLPDDFNARLIVIEKRGTEMAVKLDENTAATKEVLQLVSTFKGGMQFLGWLGIGAKWIASIAAAIAAMYAAFHLWGPK